MKCVAEGNVKGMYMFPQQFLNETMNSSLASYRNNHVFMKESLKEYRVLLKDSLTGITKCWQSTGPIGFPFRKLIVCWCVFCQAASCRFGGGGVCVGGGSTWPASHWLLLSSCWRSRAVPAGDSLTHPPQPCISATLLGFWGFCFGEDWYNDSQILGRRVCISPANMKRGSVSYIFCSEQ